jgi:hypothetical protein
LKPVIRKRNRQIRPRDPLEHDKPRDVAQPKTPPLRVVTGRGDSFPERS